MTPNEILAERLESLALRKAAGFVGEERRMDLAHDIIVEAACALFVARFLRQGDPIEALSRIARFEPDPSGDDPHTQIAVFARKVANETLAKQGGGV